jgi:hypothetical protein
VWVRERERKKTRGNERERRLEVLCLQGLLLLSVQGFGGNGNLGSRVQGLGFGVWGLGFEV